MHNAALTLLFLCALTSCSQTRTSEDTRDSGMKSTASVAGGQSIQSDAGRTNPSDAGSTTVTAPQARMNGRCGDDLVQPELGEECEINVAITQTCRSLLGPPATGLLTCMATCAYDYTMCNFDVTDDKQTPTTEDAGT